MNPGLQSVEIKDIIVNYSGSLFIFVGCFCCAIWELAWFTQYVPLKIQYGNTRKQIFLQEKWMKFLSTAGISAISFIILLACGESLDGVRIIGTIGSLLLTQTLCEFISAVYLRFRRMMMVMIVAIAGCIGFGKTLFGRMEIKIIRYEHLCRNYSSSVCGRDRDSVYHWKA